MSYYPQGRSGSSGTQGYQLITYNSGNIPVIITAIHGGYLQPRDVGARSCVGAPPACNCTTNSDLFTIELTNRMVKTLRSIYGIPYQVIANIDRLYIDFARTKSCAYDDADGEAYYDIVYNKIQEYIDTIKQTYSIVYLFDIHGTADVAAQVFIGTLNGNVTPANSSAKHLLSLDPNALSKLRTLFTTLGYTIQPSAALEAETYQGENILDIFGSQNVAGVDSFQLEHTPALRLTSSARDSYADDLASIIMDFVS